VLFGAILALAVVLLFTRLGHRPLWDDEANTALVGEGVLQSGDTSVSVGRNLVLFRNGANLRRSGFPDRPHGPSRPAD
jgi:hypothetical protein